MAITATTLSAAVDNLQTFINVVSATGITAPNFQTGIGIVLLQVDQEYMQVSSVNGTVISVVRGTKGSASAAHTNGSRVSIGAPSDFPIVSEQFSQTAAAVISTPMSTVQPGINLTGTTDAIDPTVAAFYVIKTAAVDAMTLAAPGVGDEGKIIEIVSDTLFAHTLTATSLLANGTALKTTATFPAFRGAYLKLRACNLVWEVLSNGASAGIVVLT